MFHDFVAALRHRNLVWLSGGALFAIALVAAYANHFHNSFHFDDAHTIVNNAAIRELRNIPRFFRDASTFSSLPRNQSYRPLVSTLLAIDYRLGGLQPFWFHVSILTLFVVLTALLAFVIYRLLNDAASYSGNRWIALAAAASRPLGNPFYKGTAALRIPACTSLRTTGSGAARQSGAAAAAASSEAAAAASR